VDRAYHCSSTKGRCRVDYPIYLGIVADKSLSLVDMKSPGLFVVGDRARQVLLTASYRATFVSVLSFVITPINFIFESQYLYSEA
jgi:hypothetical protein